MIQALIDKALQAEQESRKDRVRSGKWSPSSLGRCFRFQYWNRLNEPISDPVDIQGLRKFKKGKLYHEYVEQFLPVHQKEVKIETDDILGFADIVLDDAVVDIKSIHTNITHRLIKGNLDIYEDKKGAWLQVATYAQVLNKPKCGLFFIDENMTCLEFYAPTEKFKLLLDKEMDILRKYWDKKELPPAEPRCYNGKECAYCGFSTKCKEIK